MVLLLLSYSIGFMFLLYVTRNVTLVHRIKIMISIVFYGTLCILVKKTAFFLNNRDHTD